MILSKRKLIIFDGGYRRKKSCWKLGKGVHKIKVELGSTPTYLISTANISFPAGGDWHRF